MGSNQTDLEGVELLSTGGTAISLRGAGLTVIDVADFTGSPEMLDGSKLVHVVQVDVC